MSTDTDEPTVEVHPDVLLSLSMTVPVEVELPTTVLDICWWHYEAARAAGRDPEFEDYLWDVIQFEPTFTVGGDEIDMETGLCENPARQIEKRVGRISTCRIQPHPARFASPTFCRTSSPRGKGGVFSLYLYKS